MTWTWCHNAGQTLTYLKPLPKDMTVWLLPSRSDPRWPEMCCFWGGFIISSFLFSSFCFNHRKMAQFLLVLRLSNFSFSISCARVFVSASLRLRGCQQRFLVRFVCLPCNSLQRAAGPAREPLSYWFNDSSSYFAGICMSVLLSTLSTHAQSQNKKCGYVWFV